MKPGKRFGLSAIEKSDIWRRWKAGETLHEIGRAFDKPHTSIRCLLLPRGGIPPTARRRSRLALTRSEREDISRGIASGSSIREMARHLDRAASTVGREVKRHGGRPAYRTHEADDQAWESALRPKKCLLALHRRLREVVASKLILDWSPEQISGWLKTEYPKDERMRVSHETIYRSLFIQARGVLKKELMDHLRTKRRMRRSQHSRIFKDSRGQIADAISIRERPAEVEDRAVPGHWEGDLLSGSKNSHLVTLVERHSRFAMLIKVPSKDTAVVVTALSRHIRKLPATLRRSLTWDRGLEMAKHKDFTVATDVQVYFCDPQSPWQRGTNENTNLLLRQYFPRGTDLSVHSQAHLDQIALRLNQRPRKTLGIAVIVSLRSSESQRSYRHSIDEFVAWYCSAPRLSFNKTVVIRYRLHLEDRHLAAGTINVRLAAVRRLAYEAADSGLLSPDLAAGIRRVKGAKKLGCRLGNWLTAEEARTLWQLPDPATLKGKRDRAILALLLGCGLRCRELTELTVDHFQRREDHWAIVDLIGKAGHVRTIPVPSWVKQTVDDWLAGSNVVHGRLFRCVCRRGTTWGTEMTEKVVWHVVKQYAAKVGIIKLAPHDLRRSCARFCHSAGGELEQIQFLLGHVSVQTTEKYLGCKQRLREAVNDKIGIEPDPGE